MEQPNFRLTPTIFLDNIQELREAYIKYDRGEINSKEFNAIMSEIDKLTKKALKNLRGS